MEKVIKVLIKKSDEKKIKKWFEKEIEDIKINLIDMELKFINNDGGELRIKLLNNINKFEGKEIKVSDKVKEIFDYWNSKNITVHRRITGKMKYAINRKIKEYTVEEIKKTIDNYTEILKSDKYWFSYPWILVDFLNRGFEKFLDEAKPFEAYLKRDKKNKRIYEDDDRFNKIIENIEGK